MGGLVKVLAGPRWCGETCWHTVCLELMEEWCGGVWKVVDVMVDVGIVTEPLNKAVPRSCRAKQFRLCVHGLTEGGRERRCRGTGRSGSEGWPWGLG